MKKAVVFLADGFEDIEALGTVDILRRGGVEVTIAGVTGDIVTSSHNIKVMVDTLVDTISVTDYDAFVCPGGMPGAVNLKDNDKVINLLQQAYSSNKLVAAICAAPMVLERAEILKGKDFTMYPGMESYAPSGNYSSNNLVVKDGSVITGAGPAATFSYAFEILSYLMGQEKADEVAKGMLLK